MTTMSDAAIIDMVRALPANAPSATRAYAYAAAHHAGHLRKGTTIPYVSHLLAVAAMVWEHGGTDDQATAALLHDVVEDRGGQVRLDEIRQLFGHPVANIVKDCSDSITDDGQEKPPWRARKEAYVAHASTRAEASLLVSCADKVHNIESIISDARRDYYGLWERFNQKDPAQHVWYYLSLAEVFKQRLTTSGGAALAARLSNDVAELTELIFEMGEPFDLFPGWEGSSCPACGSMDIAEILYGLPSFEDADKELGGCVVSFESPRWVCRSCRLRFGSLNAGPNP